MSVHEIDSGRAEAAVLTAFFMARQAGRPTAECYKAGVDVWKCLHPEQTPEYAARKAVAVMLRAIQDDLLDVEPPHRAPPPARHVARQ
jgi:hypothetical protein